MARKKETVADAPAEEGKNTAQETQSSQVENAPENEETPASESAAPAPAAQGETTATAAEKLFSLDELEQKHRVPGWQTAALMRLMGWAAGKEVTEREYEAALDQLNNRRVGGGRL